jgi:acyl-CoA thioesterase-1
VERACVRSSFSGCLVYRACTRFDAFLGVAVSPTWFRSVRIAAAVSLVAVCGPAWAETAPIVAVGASNTSGWFIGSDNAYPERLQALLQAKGYNVEVVNAGVPFDTTNGMLARLDAAVPDQTRIVILQPGGNDLRFLGTTTQRNANLAAMVSKLRARKIQPIVFDPVIPQQYYRWDQIHLTVEGHAWIAAQLLPQLVELLGPPP